MASFLHVNGVQEAYLPLYAKAGLKAVFCGIESADTDVLLTAGKVGVDPERAAMAIRALNANNIFVIGSFIFPLPFETETSRATTRDFIRTYFGNNPKAAATFLNPFPMPGTDWWKRRKHYGFEFEDNEYLHKMMTVSLRHLLPPEMQDRVPYSMRGKDSSALSKELGAFIRELGPSKIQTGMGDDLVLIAEGCKTPPDEFKRQIIPALVCGDMTTVDWLFKTFNSARCKH
jgi:radical SAM superfamily enzyme YgiQ (UPF0313 family)